MLRRKNSQNAQSTLEYILVLTAVVGVLIWAAGAHIKPAVENSFNSTYTAIGNAADKIAPPSSKTGG